MIWPIKPFPEDKIPIARLRTAYSKEIGRLPMLCRRMVLKGVQIPDEILEDARADHRFGTQFRPVVDYSRDYDPNNPIAILGLLFNMWFDDPRLYIFPTDTVPLYDPGNGNYLNISKALLVACLEDNLNATLALFFPSNRVFLDIFNRSRTSNEKILKVLIEKGMRIDPLEIVFAIIGGNTIYWRDFYLIDYFAEDLGLEEEVTEQLKEVFRDNIGTLYAKKY